MKKILLKSTENHKIESITIGENSNALKWNFMQALLDNILESNGHNEVEALQDIKLWAKLSDEEVNQILPCSPSERKNGMSQLKSPAAETAPDELLVRIYEAIKEKAPHFLG